MRLCVLGNGRLFLGFDACARLREIFWPVVGLANHVGESAHNECLIWYDGAFHQVGSQVWHIRGTYAKGMRFDWTLKHKTLPMAVTMSDCIDPYEALWVRRVKLECRPANELGLYFRQHYHLGENPAGECGFFHAGTGRLYHYKGPYWVAITVTPDGQRTGNVLPGGAVAKVRDGGVRLIPETGGISGNSIDHGLIESIYQARWEASDGGAFKGIEATYVLAFGASKEEADAMLDKGLELGFNGVYERSCEYWGTRLGDDRPGNFYATCVKVIAAHCDRHGGVIASCDTDVMADFRDHYRYVWPRDAAMCASSLLRAGLPDYARRYLRFCNRMLSQEGFFWQRYRPDGTRGSGWHVPELPSGDLPIQEDQVGLSVLTALEYLECTHDLDFMYEVYHGFVKKAARFISEYRTREGLMVRPSYDLWEERRGVFSFTQAVSSAALLAAATIARTLGEGDDVKFCQGAFELVHGLYSYLSDDGRGFARGVLLPQGWVDWTEDASLFMVPVLLAKMEEVCDRLSGFPAVKRIRELLNKLKPRSVITWRRLERALMVRVGPEPNGIARYSGDWYCRPQGSDGLPGNPWFVTTAWYAISGYLLNLLDSDDICRWLGWFRANSLGPGILPEQINGLTGEPLSVAPLAWSHSAYIDLVALVQGPGGTGSKQQLPKIRRKKRNSAIQGE